MDLSLVRRSWVARFYICQFDLTYEPYTIVLSIKVKSTMPGKFQGKYALPTSLDLPRADVSNTR